MEEKQLSFAYESKPVTEEQKRVVQTLREMFSAVEIFLKSATPSSPTQMTALTRLEEAGMWATKTVTHGQVFSQSK